jgi:predicted nuclease of predicted toxin-antitoxin system
LPEPVFFLDESLGRTHVASVLQELGKQFVLHHERFSPGTPDKEWLAEAGKNNWIVLTKDKRIRNRPTEIRALRDSCVAAFIFSSGNLTGEQMAQSLKIGIPQIEKFLLKNKRPFVAIITKGGNIQQIKKDPSFEGLGLIYGESVGLNKRAFAFNDIEKQFCYTYFSNSISIKSEL